MPTQHLRSRKQSLKGTRSSKTCSYGVGLDGKPIKKTANKPVESDKKQGPT